MEDNQQSYEINIEKQIVRYTSILSSFAFFIAMAFVLEPILRDSNEKNREKSIIRAQGLAYQVVEIQAKKLQESVGALLAQRGPASEVTGEGPLPTGVIGTDPWGSPYHYKIRQEGKQRVVDIWSIGDHAIKTQVLIPEGYL